MSNVKETIVKDWLKTQYKGSCTADNEPIEPTLEDIKRVMVYLSNDGLDEQIETVEDMDYYDIPNSVLFGPINDIIDIENWLERFGTYLDTYASGYVEPGYTDPEKDIITSNWNYTPNSFCEYLEEIGYAFEWSDEWITCECGKLVRTSPNGYGWTPSYTIINDCVLVCCECIKDCAEDYINELINNPDKVNVFEDLDMSDYGFENMNGTFENGLHEHMNDNPKEILRDYMDRYPNHEFIFNNLGSSQFYVEFEIWGREKTED